MRLARPAAATKRRNAKNAKDAKTAKNKDLWPMPEKI